MTTPMTGDPMVQPPDPPRRVGKLTVGHAAVDLPSGALIRAVGEHHPILRTPTGWVSVATRAPVELSSRDYEILHEPHPLVRQPLTAGDRLTGVEVAELTDDAIIIVDDATPMIRVNGAWRQWPGNSPTPPPRPSDVAVLARPGR